MSSVTIHGPGELIAAIPRLLGFTPEESVVVAALRPAGEVAALLRVDRSDCLDERLAPEVGATVVRHAHRAGTARAVLVSFTDRRVSLACSAAQVLADRLSSVVDEVEAWAVTRGRFYSPGCALATCCPPGGRPVPQLELDAGATAVVGGVAHTTARLDGAAASNATEMERRRAQRAGERYWAHRSDGAAWRLASLDRWRRALAAARGGEIPTDAEAGKLIAALGDRVVRDAVLVSLVPGHARSAARIARDGGKADAAEALDSLLGSDHGRRPEPEVVQAVWLLVGRMTALARNPQRAPLLTLAALVAWWEGDAAAAARLLEDVRASDPGYRLAQLLECTLAAGIQPGWRRAG